MWPAWSNPPIVLYHGTIERFALQILQNGVNVFCGREDLDFGLGFYTTTNLWQARQWARNRSRKWSEPDGTVKLTLNRSALSQVRHLAFVRGDRDAFDYWAYVAHCRRQRYLPSSSPHGYDVVYGPVATNWDSSSRSRVIPSYDQVSFHGQAAQVLLHSLDCKAEVMV
jgi:hypothetical protein